MTNLHVKDHSRFYSGSSNWNLLLFSAGNYSHCRRVSELVGKSIMHVPLFGDWHPRRNVEVFKYITRQVECGR